MQFSSFYAFCVLRLLFYLDLHGLIHTLNLFKILKNTSNRRLIQTLRFLRLNSCIAETFVTSCAGGRHNMPPPPAS